MFVSHQPATQLLFALLIFLVYTGVYGLGHVVAKTSHPSAVLHYSLLALDCIAITAIIDLTGGIRSPLYFLYLTVFGVCLYHRDLANFVYTATLSFLLYTGLLLFRMTTEGTPLLVIAGQLILIGGLIGILYVMLFMMVREQKANGKLVSRAKTLAQISDILSGSLSNSHDWINNVVAVIDDEVRSDSIEILVNIQKGDTQFQPPSESRIGVHIPIMVGEYIFGTLIVLGKGSAFLSPEDQDFFSSVARSLGLSLHRAKLWDQLRAHVDEIKKKQKPVQTLVVEEDKVANS